LIVRLRAAYSWPLCTNMTSTIKPEVHNVSQRRHRRTERLPQVTCAKFGGWRSECNSGDWLTSTQDTHRKPFGLDAQDSDRSFCCEASCLNIVFLRKNPTFFLFSSDRCPYPGVSPAAATLAAPWPRYCVLPIQRVTKYRNFIPYLCQLVLVSLPSCR